MTTATFPAFIDAYVAALKARPLLNGVTVSTAPLGDDAVDRESIEFIGCEDAIEWSAIGRQRQDEDYAVTGVIYVVIPGKGEDTAKEARDRASLLLTEAQTALKDDPTLSITGIQHSLLSAANWVQYPNDDGRVCTVHIRVSVRARI